MPASSSTTTTAIDYVAYVEQALDFMEENHYRTDEVGWETVRGQTLAIVDGQSDRDRSVRRYCDRPPLIQSCLTRTLGSGGPNR